MMWLVVEVCSVLTLYRPWWGKVIFPTAFGDVLNGYARWQDSNGIWSRLSISSNFNKHLTSNITRGSRHAVDRSDVLPFTEKRSLQGEMNEKEKGAGENPECLGISVVRKSLTRRIIATWSCGCLIQCGLFFGSAPLQTGSDPHPTASRKPS